MKLTLIISICLISQFNYSQTYSFKTFNNTYIDLTNSTSLNNGQIWDDPTYSFPIGFDFQYFDTKVNTIYFSHIGTGAELTFNNSQTGISPILLPFGDDIIDRGYNNGNSQSNISYLLDGNVGNQILKIEWQNAGFAFGNSTDYLNMQLWLYETTNTIEIRFGPNSIEQFNSLGESGNNLFLIKQFDFDSYEPIGEMIYLNGSPETPSMIWTTQPDTVVDATWWLDSITSDKRVYQFIHNGLTADINDNNNLSLSIYPNPANEQIQINCKEKTLRKVEVISVSGQKLLMSTNFTYPIDISLLTNGVYFLKITSLDGSEQTEKLLKY